MNSKPVWNLFELFGLYFGSPNDWHVTSFETEMSNGEDDNIDFKVVCLRARHDSCNTKFEVVQQQWEQQRGGIWKIT